MSPQWSILASARVSPVPKNINAPACVERIFYAEVRIPAFPTPSGPRPIRRELAKLHEDLVALPDRGVEQKVDPRWFYSDLVRTLTLSSGLADPHLRELDLP